MDIVRRTLKEARLGAAQAHANLAVFPLWTAGPADRPYMTLDEGLHSGKVRVTEVSQHGSVPELCLVNEADLPVLLLDGEELRGAKQNRVLNLTILAPAGKTIVVPVSCVEAGRWAARSAEFQSTNHVLYAKGRAATQAFVSGSLLRGDRARSDQQAVWDSIAEKMECLATDSPTRAMHDVYRARRDGIEKFVAALRLEPGQTGAVFALNGRIAGLELFDHPDALARMFSKIVRSWALDAIESPPDEIAAPPAEAARAFLDIVAEAEIQTYPAVGQGIDVRLSAAQATGGALVDGGRVVHLNAFRRTAARNDRDHEGNRGAAGGPNDRGHQPNESWIVRASRRLRRR